jgi:RNA polymerase sigma factor (sigma-70 family)
MDLATKTTTRLLDALHDLEDEDAWRTFDERYRPIIFGVARRMGLSEADAADVAQQTIVRFLRSYSQGDYDRDRGRLRSWIVGIARHCSLDALRKRARGAGLRGESGFLDVPAPEHLEALWEAERDRVILDRAMDRLRSTSSLTERTRQAFDMVALKGMPAGDVAIELGLTVDEVYRIKHRVTKRLRNITDHLRSLHDDGL